jgi:hypothetical protein
MKKIVIGGCAAAATAAALLGAGQANAGTLEMQYAHCVHASSSLYSSDGDEALGEHGRQIAGHISSGFRNALQERNWVYNNTDASVGVIDANVLVNCATQVYLGFDSNGNAV